MLGTAVLHMSAELLLSRLKRVRRSGPDSHMASCPGPLHANGDRHPSLHVTDKSGVVLLRCFSGCEPSEVVAAAGMDLVDLFPARSDHGKPIKSPVFKSDVFKLIQHETTVVWLIGCDLQKGKSIPQADYTRLGEAVAKLERIAEAAYDS
jgi:hypothetical protein